MKKIFAAVVTALFAALPLSSTYADEEITYIYDADDMELLHTNPNGNFKLVNDIDMKGVKWTPAGFFGNLDGNGFAILNLSVDELGENIRQTFDGNMKIYDTQLSGMFDTIENATISNLSLLGLRVNIETTGKDCFVGGLSGFAYNSVITNCNIEGQISLSDSCQMFGVGGMIGYGGASSITGSSTDVTLISIDNDVEAKDEQFLGGMYAAGYIDLIENSVLIRGYDSDHGYVHSGGLLGMYIYFPEGTDYYGTMKNNSVQGFISFFEDNADRRAYCDQFYGELMNWNFLNEGNTANFLRDERTDFSQNILPHYCDKPEYKTEKIKPESCAGYPMIIYECKECGYRYIGEYAIPSHNFGYENVISQPVDYDNFGIKEKRCDDCNKQVFEKILYDEVPSSYAPIEKTTEETSKEVTETTKETEKETVVEETQAASTESQLESTLEESTMESTADTSNLVEGEKAGVNPMVILVIIVLLIAIGLTVWVFVGL